MQLQILAVGNKLPAWVNTAVEDYTKRMPRDMSVVVKEIKPEPRETGKNAELCMAAEQQRISAALPKGARVVALDEHGVNLSSLQMAEKLAAWQLDGRDVTLLIGGADGLAPELKNRADMLLRLSTFTLPHGLARVVLVEQLYRAWSILQRHPYHRE